MKHLHSLATLAVLLGVSACATSGQVATQQLNLTQAQTVLTGAQATITDWYIAKGIGQVSAGALSIAGQGALADGITTLMAVAQPNVDKLQTLINATSVDLVAVQTLIATINAQAESLRSKATPAVHVVPNVLPVVPAVAVPPAAPGAVS